MPQSLVAPPRCSQYQFANEPTLVHHPRVRRSSSLTWSPSNLSTLTHVRAKLLLDFAINALKRYRKCIKYWITHPSHGPYRAKSQPRKPSSCKYAINRLLSIQTMLTLTRMSLLTLPRQHETDASSHGLDKRQQLTIVRALRCALRDAFCLKIGCQAF